MRKDFYIVRHGETEFNLQHRQQGSGIDMELTAKGQEQAIALAQKLARCNLDVIFSSIFSIFPPAIFSKPADITIIPYKKNANPPHRVNIEKMSIIFSPDYFSCLFLVYKSYSNSKTTQGNYTIKEIDLN